MRPEIFQEVVLFHVGAAPVTRTMLTSLGLSLVLLLLMALLRRAAVRRPDGAAAAVAHLAVEAIDGLVRDVVDHPEPRLADFVGSLFLFIAGSTLAGQLPGVRPPMASLAATTALSVLVFVAVPAVGVRVQGLRGYLAHYFRPNPLLFPLHLLSEISRTLALSVRLFGNMMSGHLIVALLVALTGFLVPTPLMALDLLIGFLQAYIFTILATVYIGAALRAGEGI